MESTSTARAPTLASGGDKGLKKNAIGFLSSAVIGVASTAPGYSLAAVLGIIAAAVGFQSPAVLIVSFLPMLFIAAAYYHMNRADPDCGTTFTWATRAMGPHLGWMGGWAIIVADIIVMANLAQIAGLYTFKLVGWQGAADSVVAVTALGCLWIAIMTAIVAIGVELSARTQNFLLGAEVITLAVFAVVALVKVYAGDIAGSLHPSLSWVNPLEVSSLSALSGGMLIGVFIYWGWDSAVTVNEETEDSARAPGVAAIVSTLVLVGIYVVVSIAAQAYGGAGDLVKHQGDVLSALGTQVFGSPLDKIVIIAVLTSAAAATQTTILPTARTTLSMARAGALPKRLGDVHPRYLTPVISTVLTGLISIAWYAGLTAVSENILLDSILALGLMIAFYYGLTGVACAVYYRRELLKSVKSFLLVGVAPVTGSIALFYLFVRNCIQLANPAESTAGDEWLGVGPPLVIGAGLLLLGLPLMLAMRRFKPEFFKQSRPSRAALN